MQYMYIQYLAVCGMHRGMEEIYLSVPAILLDVRIKMLSASHLSIIILVHHKIGDGVGQKELIGVDRKIKRHQLIADSD